VVAVVLSAIQNRTVYQQPIARLKNWRHCPLPFVKKQLVVLKSFRIPSPKHDLSIYTSYSPSESRETVPLTVSENLTKKRQKTILKEFYQIPKISSTPASVGLQGPEQLIV
jgi:hypothetical protein